MIRRRAFLGFLLSLPIVRWWDKAGDDRISYTIKAIEYEAFPIGATVASVARIMGDGQWAEMNGVDNVNPGSGMKIFSCDMSPSGRGCVKWFERVA